MQNDHFTNSIFERLISSQQTQRPRGKQMTEKLTGLEWRDFVAMRLGIKALIESYQGVIDSGFVKSDYWENEIATLKTTLRRIDENRAYER